MVALTADLMKTFRIAKTFRENVDRINHMDISANGQYVVTSSQDENIHVYEADKGVLSGKAIQSRKYGVDLITFTRNPNLVIHGSTKIDDHLRQLNLHENKYHRYFQGHTKKVTSVKMHPKDDLFMSASLDKTVRLWDLRSCNSQGLVPVSGRPVVSYDPEGLVFALGFDSSEVKLYDIRTFDKGPFLSFPVPRIPEGEWTDLKFNPDTTQILVCTSGKTSYVVDAYVGGVLFTLTGYANSQNLPIEGCYSPDGKYILMGSTDGKVHVWSTAGTGEKLATLGSEDSAPITSLKFNPKYMCFVSAHIKTSLWIPTIPEFCENENSSVTNHVDAKSSTPLGARTPV